MGGLRTTVVGDGDLVKHFKTKIYLFRALNFFLSPQGFRGGQDTKVPFPSSLPTLGTVTVGNVSKLPL